MTNPWYRRRGATRQSPHQHQQRHDDDQHADALQEHAQQHHHADDQQQGGGWREGRWGLFLATMACWCMLLAWFKATLEALCGEYGFRFVAPPHILCTDNAAMVAMAGYHRYLRGEFTPLDATPFARSNH